MNTLYILGGIVVVLVLFALGRRQSDETLTEYTGWDDSGYEPPAHTDWSLSHPSSPAPRFEAGQAYIWEQIEDLLWAYGYTRDEIKKQWNHNYIEIWRDGLHAEFDGSMGQCRDDGELLYACYDFDPNADTSKSDRWRRAPNEDERRNAVWR
jgi:hypothetical protein